MQGFFITLIQHVSYICTFFSTKVFFPGHGPTNFRKWAVTNSSYAVRYERWALTGSSSYVIITSSVLTTDRPVPGANVASCPNQ